MNKLGDVYLQSTARYCYGSKYVYLIHTLTSRHDSWLILWATMGTQAALVTSDGRPVAESCGVRTIIVRQGCQASGSCLERQGIPVDSKKPYLNETGQR